MVEIDLVAISHLKVVPVCGAITFGLTLIFACIAVPMSFASLDQGQYGLELDWSTQKIGDDVVTEPGMYTVGLGNMLVTFNSTFQTMHFKLGGDRGPLRARSADGLEMHASVSFQFRFEPTSLKPLYYILGDHLYIDEFVRFARASLVEVCSHFKAERFFTERQAITSAMLVGLKAAFRRPGESLDLEIVNVQLGTVDLPDEFEKEIQSMMAQQQEVEIANAERGEQLIIKTRELLVAEQKILELVEIAYGDAEGIHLYNNAVVDQIVVKATKRADSNRQILAEFANDPYPYGRLLDVMEVRMLEAHEASRMMVNFG